MAAPPIGGGGGGGGGSGRQSSAAAAVAEQISQAVQSTSNLLHLMRDSSPSQTHLIKLPRNLLAKVSTIKNTGFRATTSGHCILRCLHRECSTETIAQLLSNMESSQLKSMSTLRHPGEFKDSDSEISSETSQKTIKDN